jgi:hypothetical protein
MGFGNSPLEKIRFKEEFVTPPGNRNYQEGEGARMSLVKYYL